MSLRIFTVLTLMLFTGLHAASKSVNRLQYNTIRMAYIDIPGIKDPDFSVFAQRLIDNRYNYIYVKVNLDYINVIDPTFEILQRDWQFVFTEANKYGLRVIPFLQIGSKWSQHWRYVPNPDLQMNLFIDRDTLGTPSFARHDSGIDKSFVDIVTIINRAFLAADMPYELEFFHLGGEEPLWAAPTDRKDCGRLLIGDGSVRYSLADRAAILDKMKSGKSVSVAHQELIVDHWYRRLQQIQSVCGTHTKIMIYGDMFDPQANGANPKKAFNGRPVILTPGIGTLPGLAEMQKALFQKNTILIPWCYYKAWPWSGDPDGNGTYDETTTFNYFKNNGFRFMYVADLYTNNNNLTDPYAIAAMTEYARASRNYGDHCVGYQVLFGDWRYAHNENLMFSVIEQCGSAGINSDYIPPCSNLPDVPSDFITIDSQAAPSH